MPSGLHWTYYELKFFFLKEATLYYITDLLWHMI